jgi:hypothetical protein
MRIRDIYRFVKKKDKVEVMDMFEFLKHKRTTQLKPETREEELAFLKSKNSHDNKELALNRAIASEKVKAKELKKEAFKQTITGKVLSAVGSAKEHIQELQKKRGKGGLSIGINSAYLK